MKTISLYTNNGSWLTQLHPFTKLWYLAAAICIPLLTGSLWGFAVMIIISFVLLKIIVCSAYRIKYSEYASVFRNCRFIHPSFRACG